MVTHQRVVDKALGKGLLPAVPLSSFYGEQLRHATSIIHGSRYDTQQALRAARLLIVVNPSSILFCQTPVPPVCGLESGSDYNLDWLQTNGLIKTRPSLNLNVLGFKFKVSILHWNFLDFLVIGLFSLFATPVCKIVKTPTRHCYTSRSTTVLLDTLVRLVPSGLNFSLSTRLVVDLINAHTRTFQVKCANVTQDKNFADEIRFVKTAKFYTPRMCCLLGYHGGTVAH